VTPLTRAGDFVRGLSGWRRFLFAFATGALSALSFAPWGLFPLLLFSFAALVLLIDGAQSHSRPVRSAAVAGWAYGFGQFLVGLYWVAYAFLVDPLEHAWQLPFIAIIFPGGLALFQLAACAVASRFWRGGYARVFLFATCYAAAEWLRGNILTGFPWNIPGYGWGASLAVLQTVAFIGVYGLSLLTILFGASIALLFDGPRAWRVPAAFALLFALMWIGGIYRLNTTHVGDVPNVHLRLVQPNVPQDEKYIRDRRLTHWRELVQLSLAPGNGPAPTHVIWPEAAPPFLLSRELGALQDITVITGANRVLMTGTVRATRTPGEQPHFFNSFDIFGPGGTLIATYDKFHLVPLGEYVPMRKIMEPLGLSKLVNIPGSFDAGDGPHTYDIPGAPPVGPLICYEILFPGEVTAERRPSWLVNVTDDSWFGPSSSAGPKQHLLVARIRAIEEGLPVARDANTGVTAIIDPLGRIAARIPANEIGFLDAPLPKSLPKTYFVSFRGWAFLLLLIASFTAAFLPSSNRRVT
jgi:apolipoprotein N-acyltransferase